MPSHLTRQIFRRLLANEPIVYRGCLRRQAYSSLTRASRNRRALSAYNGRDVVRYEQRRTFLNFNFFHRKEKAEVEADMDPGLEKMMELEKRQRMRARMPPMEEVAKALGDFFESKVKRKAALTDNQASLAHQSLQYYLTEQAKLQEQEAQEQQDALNEHSELLQMSHSGSAEPKSSALQSRHMTSAIDTFKHLPNEVTQSHVQLAKILYEIQDSEQWPMLMIEDGKPISLLSYVQVLTISGNTNDAKLLVRNVEKGDGSATRAAVDPAHFRIKSETETMEEEYGEDGIHINAPTSEVTACYDRKGLNFFWRSWTFILRGFVREGNKAEVEKTMSILRDRGVDQTPSVCFTMVDYNIMRNDLPEIIEWWNIVRDKKLRSKFSQVRAETLTKILDWCLEHNEVDAGHGVVKDIMQENPPKAMWDAIFVWAAGTGKGPDEIDRMIGVMEKSNDDIPDESRWRLADIVTINALVEFAVKRKDPYMAERFITMGRNRNIEPDAQTYVLQMKYRLSVDDVDGALIAYKNLQAQDLSSNEDLPTVNNLIVALCKTQRHDFDTIMNVAADLSDRKARFEQVTVSALTLLHLKRDEANDVLDLLNTHAYHYSTAERAAIRDTILDYALDPKTPTTRAWSVYQIINTVFDETPRPQRTDLMTSFISRERADMGVRIFQQMRAHSRTDTMPTIDTYVSAFLALAKVRDLDSLEVIHNQLKLDYNVQPTTYLYNALMLAHIACGDASHGLRFWSDIVASKEGPSYNSIHIALRACEKTAFGDLKAREIWSLLRRRNVELDHNLWCSYLSALCGNGDVDQSLNAAEEAESKGELVVDAFLVGSLCDAVPGYTEKQGMVEQWAQDQYPEVWKTLCEEVGFEEVIGKGKRFKIDRRVAP